MEGAVVLRGELDGMRRVRRRMALAFLLLGWLAMLGAGLVAYQMLAGLRAPLDQARRAEDKVLYSSEVSRNGTAVAASLYRHALAPLSPAEAADVRLRLQDMTRLLEEIGPLITPQDEAIYARARPLFAGFRAAALEALSAGERGDQAQVSRILQERLLPVLTEARALADTMIEENRTRAAAFLHHSNEHMHVVLWATLICAGLFILLIAAAGCYTVRIVRMQQDRITDQMTRLEQAISDLDAFAGRIAHDLRGPLGPILLTGEQLQRTQDPAVVERAAERILRSAARANDLIESLLAFSRSGQARPGGHCDASKAAERAIEETRDAARTAGIDLQVEVAALEVAIEEAFLAQSLQNLIGNAIRYMPAERDDRRICVRGRHHSGQARFEVADTGAGIPARERERIFRPFYRIHETSPSVRGTGLGLATVQRIIEAYRGRIGVDDNPDGGATVWFTVPLAARKRAPASADPEQTATVSAAALRSTGPAAGEGVPG